jgi:hypothetical protein
MISSNFQPDFEVVDLLIDQQTSVLFVFVTPNFDG